MTALNRKTLQTGSSRSDQDLPRWMRAEPTPLSWRVGYRPLLAITVAWACVLVVLLGAAALSWLAGLLGGAL